MTDNAIKPDKALIKNYAATTLENHFSLIENLRSQTGETEKPYTLLVQSLNTLLGTLVYLTETELNLLYTDDALIQWMGKLEFQNEDYAIDYDNPAETDESQLVFFLLERIKSSISQGTIKFMTEANSTIHGIRFADFQTDKFRQYTKRSFRITLSIQDIETLLELIRNVLS